MPTSTLGYVPYLRPGALLFTLVAFRRLQTKRDKDEILVDLYGTTGGRKRNLFGAHVATITNRAFGGVVSPRDVLLNHTLFGVYSRSLSSVAAEAWGDALITKNRRWSAQSAVRSIYGSKRFQPATKNLRSCSRCVAEDIDLFGFGQWHILHQVPSILFCPEHALPLVEEAYGGNGGNVWQYALPHGLRSDQTNRGACVTSDGHSIYLELWKQLFDGKLHVLSSHAWATYMDLFVAKVGDLASAEAEIENAIRRTWSTDSATVKSVLGHQVMEEFIHAELSHNSSPARLAQKLIVLGAMSALGIEPLQANEASQLRIDFSSVAENTFAIPLQEHLRGFLLDVALPASLASLLLVDQHVTEIARSARVHRGKIWRAIERIPDQLLQKIASAQMWSSQSWITRELKRRKKNRPTRLRR